MRSKIIAKRTAKQTILLAIALGAPTGTLLALTTDASDQNTARQPDAASVSRVWDQPATPAPVIVVRPPAEPQSPMTPQRALSPNPLWEIPLSSLSVTRERPIFSPSRRPPPPAVASASVVPAQPPPKPPRIDHPQLSLVGTVAGEEESFGIFLDQTTKAALRLRIGEDYQGWKLRAVKGREVTLEYDQQIAILTLPEPGAVALTQPLTRQKAEAPTVQKQADPSRRD
jgi:hypothetical protein